MPYALLAIGLILAIAAYNNTQGILSAQIQKDMAGKTGFIYWIAAIIIVGAIGYIKPLETVSRAFLLLILVVVFLTNGGVFAQFNNALSGAGSSGDAKTLGGNAEGESGPLEITVQKAPGT